MTTTLKIAETGKNFVSIRSELSRDGHEFFTVKMYEKRGGQWYPIKEYIGGDIKKARSAFNRYTRQIKK